MHLIALSAALFLTGCADTGADSDSDTDADAGTDAEGGGGASFDGDTVGGEDDGWRPSSETRLTCPWLPQVPPGDWGTADPADPHTLNCGPTSLIMASACMNDGGTPGSDDIVSLITWMDDNISSYGGVGVNNNGSATTSDQIVSASEGYFGIDAVSFSATSLSTLNDELASGQPVVVATYTQGSNNYPSDVMVAGGAKHFMLLVGMTQTHVVLNDPGRSASSNGENREYTIDSFYPNWQNNAGVSFGDTSTSTP